MNAPDFVLETGLSDRARLLAQLLNRLVRRCYSDCLCATRTLARKLGWSERKVNLAVSELAGHGMVEVIRDYGLRTRRRIRLVWRALTTMPVVPPQPALVPDASVGANADGECQLEFALTDPSPLIKVSEDNTEGGRTDGPPAGEPAPAAGEAEASSSPQRSLPPEEEEPEPEVIAALVREAAPILKTGPATEGKVREMMRKHAPEWVKKALGITARQAARRRLDNPVGYTFGVLGKFESEGLPAAVSARTPNARPTDEAKARFQAAMEARRKAREGGSP